METTTKQKRPATASDVRAWARRRGLTVGQRGHLPQSVIDQYNRWHRNSAATNSNPWRGEARRKEGVA